MRESYHNRMLKKALVSVLLAGAPCAFGQNLPDLGASVGGPLSPQIERRIGESIMREIRFRDPSFVDDPEVSDYLYVLGNRLVAASPGARGDFEFFAIRDPSINAFALPGGFVIVNTGLLLASQSESELASVLAHEIAHVTQRHIARSIQNAGRANLASAAAILAATGFDPVAMPDFFWTMQQRAGSAGKNIPDLLRSHPVTTERIAETRNRVKEHERPRHEDSTSYPLIRARLAVQSLPPEADFRDLYGSARSADLPSTEGELYGRALALLRADAAGEAIPLLQDLLERRPDVTLYRTALGQAQLEAGRIAASRTTLAEAMRLFPRNVPVTMRYAETLMRDADPKQAHIVLLDLFNNVPPTPEQARFTALAANAAGDVADAYYYMSEYHVISGDLALAIDQLRLASAVPGLNDVQRQRFDARIRELQEYLPKGRRAKEIPGPTNPQPDASRPR